MFGKMMLIALGGAFGAVARVGTGRVMLPLSTRWGLPWGTMAANLIGCFFIGLLQGIFLERWQVRPEWRLAGRFALSLLPATRRMMACRPADRQRGRRGSGALAGSSADGSLGAQERTRTFTPRGTGT